MRIARNTLYRRWLWTSALAALLFCILRLLDARLKSQTGFDTADLRGLDAALPLRAVFFLWSSAPNAVLAGFLLGLDYLFIPLYAAAFFYSGVIAAESFAPRPGRLRRILGLAAMVPLVGGLCEGFEKALQLWMFQSGTTDLLARLAAMAGKASLFALVVGLVLFAAAVAGRFAALKKAPDS